MAAQHIQQDPNTTQILGSSQDVLGGPPQRQFGRGGSQAPPGSLVPHHSLPHQQRRVSAACSTSMPGWAPGCQAQLAGLASGLWIRL